MQKHYSPTISYIKTAIAVILIVGTALATTPSVMNYQGQLTDASGLPLDGKYDLTFSLYDQEIGGTLLWQESQSVQVTSGLFDVMLGSGTPLTTSVFEGFKVFLGIAVDSDPEMSPRQQISTTAYAHRVTTIDRATGGSVVGDVEILGDLTNINTSFLSQLRLGNPSLSGGLALFDAGSSNPTGVLQSNDEGGGELRLYDPSYGNSVVTGRDVSAGNGGYLSLYRNGAGAAGVVIDGNYSGTQSPRITMQDDNSAVIFDLGVDGDSAVMLPYSTINSLETANESGVASKLLQTPLGLDNPFPSPVLVLSQAINCPRNGFVLAIATAHLYVDNTDGIAVEVEFGISEFTSSLQLDNRYRYRHQPTTNTGTDESVITVHDLFFVSEGQKELYFLAKQNFGTEAQIINARLTLVYLPTWYGPLISPPTASMDSIEKLVEESVKDETARLEAQFEARLRELESTISEQTKAD